MKQNIENVEAVSITDTSLIHQVKDVLRLKAGDPIILLDGEGTVFHGKIETITQQLLNISKEKMKKFIKSGKLPEVHLFASVIKKDKFEWVLQKATELGVSRITPVVSHRTEKLNINMKRAEKIIQEAVEQSERSDIPVVNEPISLTDVLTICETEALVFDTEGEKVSVSQLREMAGVDKKVSVFIGPEGGWSEKDFDIFRDAKCGYKKVSVGNQVLRAETASVAVCSLLLLGVS